MDFKEKYYQFMFAEESRLDNDISYWSDVCKKEFCCESVQCLCLARFRKEYFNKLFKDLNFYLKND